MWLDSVLILQFYIGGLDIPRCDSDEGAYYKNLMNTEAWPVCWLLTTPMEAVKVMIRIQGTTH